MFDENQRKNIRNALFKYVDSPRERSKIVWVARTLANEEAKQEDQDAVFWSTLWFCSQDDNRAEFEDMYKQLMTDGVAGFDSLGEITFEDLEGDISNEGK